MKTVDIPILKGFLTNDEKQFEVWCPFCKKYHLHGADEELKTGKKSHRVAHCSKTGSSFSITGYFLQLEKRIKGQLLGQ